MKLYLLYGALVVGLIAAFPGRLAYDHWQATHHQSAQSTATSPFDHTYAFWQTSEGRAESAAMDEINNIKADELAGDGNSMAVATAELISKLADVHSSRAKSALIDLAQAHVAYWCPACVSQLGAARD